MGLVVKLAQGVSLSSCSTLVRQLTLAALFPARTPSVSKNAYTDVLILISAADRDSGNWNLSAEETFKRRSLLWEIYVYDSWQVREVDLFTPSPAVDLPE